MFLLKSYSTNMVENLSGRNEGTQRFSKIHGAVKKFVCLLNFYCTFINNQITVENHLISTVNIPCWECLGLDFANTPGSNYSCTKCRRPRVVRKRRWRKRKASRKCCRPDTTEGIDSQRNDRKAKLEKAIVSIP